MKPWFLLKIVWLIFSRVVLIVSAFRVLVRRNVVVLICHLRLILSLKIPPTFLLIFRG